MYFFEGSTPMLLTIDCGNTNTVFSIWNGTEFIATWRTSTQHQRTADQYFVWLSTLMLAHQIAATIPDVVVAASVPRVVFNLRVFCERYFNCRPLVSFRGNLNLQAPQEGRAKPKPVAETSSVCK